MAFDASMAETWPTLVVGAALHQVPDKDIRIQPAKLIQWYTDERITISFLTTQLAEVP